MQVLHHPGAGFVSLQRPIFRLWRFSLLALVVALPFELVAPWIAVGELFVLTNVELLLFLALGLWLAQQALREHSFQEIAETPLATLLLFLFAALALSAFMAPSHQREAWKIVFRWLTGIAVYFMFASAVRSGMAVWQLLQASVAASIVVAVIACLEVTQSNLILPLLQLFREEPFFRVGGDLRASATLAYSTIASFYLEVNFILIVGWLARTNGRGAQEWTRRAWLRVGLLGVGLLLVGQAIVFTLTRSAFAAIGLALLLSVSIRFREFKLDAFARVALGAVIALAGLLGVSFLIQPAQQVRFASATDRTWYRAQLNVAPLPVIHAGERITATVQLRNSGERTWNATGENAILLFYHWLLPDGKTAIVVNGLRTPLPRDIAPQESVTLEALVVAPPDAGEYILAWDMLRENLFWFSFLGAPTYNLPVTIEPSVTPSLPVSAPPAQKRLAQVAVPDRSALWRSALAIFATHPILGVGPGNFRFVHSADGTLNAVTTHANNTYLEMFADTGLIGGGLFLLFVLALLRFGWQALHKPAPAFVQVTLATALAAFMIHAVTDYFLEFTVGYVMFWMTAGLLVGLLHPTIPRTVLPDQVK